MVTLAVAAASQTTQPGAASFPSESGMYVGRSNGFDKILGQIVAFTRSGSLFVSKVTVGIKTRKQNVQLLGPHAQIVVDDKPTFFFIPPKQEAEAGVNAGDLVLVRLEEKPERRQFEIGAQGVGRASSGISITHQIQLLRSEAKPGVYTITPASPIAKGEYALYLSRGEGMQAYVYDFSVVPECCGISDRSSRTETKLAASSPKTAPVELAATATKADKTPSLGEAQTSAGVIAELSSEPSGADVEIDGSFIGSTPSSVGIAAGQHAVRLSKSGYKTWERTLKTSTGKIKIDAVLEPIPVVPPPGSAPPAQSSAISEEEARIGVWFSGNPTTKHDGVEISGVQPKGPADLMGIQPGDVILAIDGHFLYTINQLRAELSRHDKGTRLLLRYRHDRLTYENYFVP